MKNHEALTHNIEMARDMLNNALSDIDNDDVDTLEVNLDEAMDYLSKATECVPNEGYDDTD